jgi:hypothetical protein
MNCHAKRLESVQLVQPPQCCYEGRAGAGARRGAVRKREQAPRPLQTLRAVRLQLGGPSGSAKVTNQEESDHGPSEDQAPHAGAAVFVREHTDQAEDKAERRRQEYSQPAKG